MRGHVYDMRAHIQRDRGRGRFMTETNKLWFVRGQALVWLERTKERRGVTGRSFEKALECRTLGFELEPANKREVSSRVELDGICSAKTYLQRPTRLESWAKKKSSRSRKVPSLQATKPLPVGR